MATEITFKQSLYTTTWKIMRRANSYSISKHHCNLWEKVFIVTKLKVSLLNKYTEIICKCFKI